MFDTACNKLKCKDLEMMYEPSRSQIKMWFSRPFKGKIGLIHKILNQEKMQTFYASLEQLEPAIKQDLDRLVLESIFD